MAEIDDGGIILANQEANQEVNQEANQEANQITQRPKRPMSAFLLWLCSARSQIKAQHPGLKVTQIAKKGGEIWRNMQDKTKWEEKAKRLREKYTRDLEAYNERCGGAGERPLHIGRARRARSASSSSYSYDDESD